MQNKITKRVKENLETVETLLSGDFAKSIEKIAGAMVSCIKKGNKILIFGNGGSASDSQHFAAELVGRFKKERKGLPAMALTANTSVLTALSNDYGYEISFARQIEALGKKGDVAIGISTSGKAKNVFKAMKKAGEMGLVTIALCGKGGGELKDAADVCVIVKSDDTPRVQEAHILMIHIICEIVEDEFEN